MDSHHRRFEKRATDRLDNAAAAMREAAEMLGKMVAAARAATDCLAQLRTILSGEFPYDAPDLSDGFRVLMALNEIQLTQASHAMLQDPDFVPTDDEVEPSDGLDFD